MESEHPTASDVGNGRSADPRRRWVRPPSRRSRRSEMDGGFFGGVRRRAGGGRRSVIRRAVPTAFEQRMPEQGFGLGDGGVIAVMAPSAGVLCGGGVAVKAVDGVRRLRQVDEYQKYSPKTY